MEKESREKKLREYNVYVVWPNSLHPMKERLDHFILTIVSIHTFSMNLKERELGLGIHGLTTESGLLI